MNAVITCSQCGGIHEIPCPHSEDPKLVGEVLSTSLVKSLGSALSFLETALDSGDMTKVRTYLGDCKNIHRAIKRINK
jgi:hypothetical protein